jgi:hypothetical protein
MEALEYEQRLRKTFVDRHLKWNELQFGKGKAVLLFQSRSGLMPEKLRLRWTGPYWIVNEERHIPAWHSFGGGTTPMGERISPKAILRKVAGQPISSQGRFGRGFGGSLGHEHEVKQPYLYSGEPMRSY